MEKVFVPLLASTIPNDALRAARAILDFIYLAQYPSHSTTTLQWLEAALQRFHAHKHTFVDHKVRVGFQIPKIHMMEHYVQSIKSRGTADGYNTELPECLHIDFAKVAYHASNKRNYPVQMMKWITRQEQMHAFGAYVRWHDPSSYPDVAENERENDDEDSDSEPEEEEAVGWSYHLAKRPGFPNTPVHKIIQDFHAPFFLLALHTYMQHYLPGATRRINENTRLDVYKRVRFTLSSIQRIEDTTIDDVVRATPSVPCDGRTAGTPARFDTAIIHYGKETKETGAQGQSDAPPWTQI
jgi:hypothetical protein